jgi:hypothetical protein
MQVAADRYIDLDGSIPNVVEGIFKGFCRQRPKVFRGRLG